MRTNCGQSEIKHVLAPKLLSHVIKELVHAFSCAYIELWMHLGSLESTQEARVAPRATLTLLSCSPNFPRASVTRYTHAKHEPILKLIANNRTDTLKMKSVSRSLSLLDVSHKLQFHVSLRLLTMKISQ